MATILSHSGKIPVTESRYTASMNNTLLSTRRHAVRPLRHLRPANTLLARERFYFQTISVWSPRSANDNALPLPESAAS